MCQGPEPHFHEILLNMSLPGPRATKLAHLLVYINVSVGFLVSALYKSLEVPDWTIPEP